MEFKKTCYSEKLGKNLSVKIFESDEGVMSTETSNYRTIYGCILDSFGCALFTRKYRLYNDSDKYVNALNKIIEDYEYNVKTESAAIDKFKNTEKLEEKNGCVVLNGVKVITTPCDTKTGKVVSDAKDSQPIVLNITINNPNNSNSGEAIKTIVEGLKRLGVNVKQ